MIQFMRGWPNIFRNPNVHDVWNKDFMCGHTSSENEIIHPVFIFSQLQSPQERVTFVFSA